MLAGGDFVFRRTVGLDSELFQQAQALLDHTFTAVVTKDRRDGPMPECLSLRKLTRIFNCGIWQEYRTRRQEISEEIDNFPPGWRGNCLTQGLAQDLIFKAGTPDESQAHEQLLWHGTSWAGAMQISEGDFKVDLAGSNAGTLYGRGIYLAEASSKSDEYTVPDGPSGRRTLLLCQATLGRVLYTDEQNPDTDDLVAQCKPGPEARFHSVLGDREKIRGTYKEFVVYDGNQVYPACILEYDRNLSDKVQASS
eukprot:TRINITY_DN23398_c0_g1_i1.p1 TRINITY_DN23398_c0_g1~~TRINITY_DN23398_c0_g1_i1.p1  ORF type:complete len:289 (+),score=34.86 TRINITY_DN23398_c0_g1_i1:113-868(+)